MNKYIKTYEKYESKILNNTLSFINKDYRNAFLNTLKKICDQNNFPYSKLSDDLFQYLPFKKALLKTDSSLSLPCGSKSIDQFDEHGIEGEVCTRGMIKRKWGKSIRSVKCNVCKGTGIKAKDNSITLIKFWFTSDGRYIEKTCFNNNIQLTSILFSRNINDYTIKKENVTREELNQLEQSDIILLKPKYDEDPVVSFIFKEGDGIFALQDSYDGDTPSANFTHIAEYSWIISGGDYYRISLLEKNDNENEIDPYKYNLLLNDNITINKYGDIKTQLRNAEFAIILDIDKLKKSNFNVNLTRSDRNKVKSGATALMKNEDIKKINIDKYINELSNRMNIHQDISNCNKLISKILSRDYLLFYFCSINIPGYFEKIIKIYYYILGNEFKESYIDELSAHIKSLYKNSREFHFKLDKNIINYKFKLESLDNDNYIIFFQKIIEINRDFYDKILSIDIETIDDFELVVAKIKSFIWIFTNDRFIDYSVYNNIIPYMSSGYNVTDVIKRIDYLDLELQIKNLDRIKRLVKKL